MGYQHVRDKKKKKKAFQRAFLTKAQAARKLSLAPDQFKRLCILKGVYPRHAKHIPEGCGIKSNSQFYFNKDINWMMEDPIFETLFAYKSYKKKMTRFVGRGDLDKAKHHKENHKPQYSLVHCVRERYPTFLEAVRDMDDALCHVFLYAQLPPHLVSQTTIEGHRHLPTGLSEKSKKLYERWNEYVAKARALRKVFISVKGYYFQAEIAGQTVTWLVPHYYTTQMPGIVDYNVMITFLEFYVVLLDFILFRLESEYREEMGKKKLEAQEQALSAPPDDENTADFPVSPDDIAVEEEKNRCAKLFDGLKFFINSEVPNAPFRLMCLAAGGQIAKHDEDSKITHQVVDRPVIKDMIPNRDYVQPQWLADCINCKHVLPVDQYLPGKELPPHLSPFEEAMVTDHLGRAYEPERLQELNRIMDPTYHALAAKLGEDKESDVEEEENLEDSDSEEESLPDARPPSDGIVTDDDDDDEEDDAQPKQAIAPKVEKPEEPKKVKEMDKEKAYQLATEKKKKKEEAEKRMRSLMLSNKKRKLWEKIQFSRKRKDAAVAQLGETRRKVAEGKLKVVAPGVLVDPAKEGQKVKIQPAKRRRRKY